MLNIRMQCKVLQVFVKGTMMGEAKAKSSPPVLPPTPRSPRPKAPSGIRTPVPPSGSRVFIRPRHLLFGVTSFRLPRILLDQPHLARTLLLLALPRLVYLHLALPFRKQARLSKRLGQSHALRPRQGRGIAIFGCTCTALPAFYGLVATSFGRLDIFG